MAPGRPWPAVAAVGCSRLPLRDSTRAEVSAEASVAAPAAEAAPAEVAAAEAVVAAAEAAVAAQARRATPRWAQTLRREIEVLDDFRTEHAGDIGSGRDAASGRDFLRDAATANDFAAFEHEHGEASASEISGRGKAVVPCSDDDDVPSFCGRRRQRESGLEFVRKIREKL